MTKTKQKIKATLKILSRVYKADGKTVEEVITNLEPPIAKTIGILTLEKGKRKKERIINPRMVMGLWGKQSPTMKNIAMKNLINLFGDFND